MDDTEKRSAWAFALFLVLQVPENVWAFLIFAQVLGLVGPLSVPSSGRVRKHFDLHVPSLCACSVCLLMKLPMQITCIGLGTSLTLYSWLLVRLQCHVYIVVAWPSSWISRKVGEIDNFLPPFTFHLGFVHPLQDVALCQYLPLSSVCCFPVPGGSLLPCYVVLPSSAWSSSWSLLSPWLPLCAAFGSPIVLHSCYKTRPSPLLLQCVFCTVNHLCSFPDFWAWYLFL